MSENVRDRAPRYELSSIKAVLNDQTVEIVDVSPTGLLVKNADASLERGDAVTVTLSVPLMKKSVPVPVDGFVVRSDERGTAIDYVRPATAWPHILRILNLREGA
ncbi:MAG: PilZ domain-containing protein [Rhodospirillales bacterium]